MMLRSQNQSRETKHRRIDTSTSLQEDRTQRPCAATPFLGRSTKSANHSPSVQDVIKKLLAFDLKSDNASAVETAMKILLRFYDDSLHSDRRCMGSSETIVAIVSAMEKWYLQERVQEYGCALMKSVLHDFRENATVWAPLGDITDAIEGAMRNHSQALKVQQYSCLALSNLFSGCDRTLADCAVRFVKPQGGLQFVLRAMEQFHDDARLQNGALDLLHNLFAYLRCSIPIRVSGAITAVAKAIENHRDNTEVQASGRDVMKCFFP